MTPALLIAFSRELEKISAAKTKWERMKGSTTPEVRKIVRQLDYHFDPKAGKEKWDKFIRRAADETFVSGVSAHPLSDSTLVRHARGMLRLAKGKPAGKVQSATLPGKSYEIRKIPGNRLACTCNDWRYRGSISPGYKCKHIRAFKSGYRKVV